MHRVPGPTDTWRTGPRTLGRYWVALLACATVALAAPLSGHPHGVYAGAVLLAGSLFALLWAMLSQVTVSGATLSYRVLSREALRGVLWPAMRQVDLDGIVGVGLDTDLDALGFSDRWQERWPDRALNSLVFHLRDGSRTAACSTFALPHVRPLVIALLVELHERKVPVDLPGSLLATLVARYGPGR